MYQLDAFFEKTIHNGCFLQTQFANTDQPHSLCFAANERYIKIATDNPAISAIVTTLKLAETLSTSKGLVALDAPEASFYHLHNALARDHQMRPDISPRIDESAQVHPTAHVDPYTQIGADVVIGPGAVIMNGSVLEDGVVIGPNAVIGADGHFFKRFGDDLVSVAHAGGVWLRRQSHVLASAVVSKSLHTDFTQIGAESVVSVKSHVGHGCCVGDRTIIAGASQISGYTQIGNDVWIGPGVTIGNLLKIGDNASIEAGSVVITNLADGARVSGNYAVAHTINMIEFARKRRGRKP